jgi:signal transduction histidine kinase
MLRILIVEDEALVAADLQRMLSKREDTSVLVAAYGEDALRQAAGSQPDLVLMDIELSGKLDGVMTAKLLRKQLDVPIIYLNSNSDQVADEGAQTTHPGSYLATPIDSQELEAAIEIALVQHDAEQKLRKSEEQLRLLYRAEHESRQMAETLVETSQVLASSLDVNVVLDRILEQVSRVVDNDVCNIMLIEGEGTQTVRSRGYEAFDAETFIETFVFPLSGLSVRQQIIDTGKPVVVSDVRTDPQWALPAGAAWLRSYVAAPIYLGDEVIGFINVGNSRAGFYDLSHAGRLQAFGHQAALAFQNARLYEATRVNAANLQILSRRLLDVQESERRSIARELHDEIGQALTAAKLNLQSLQKHPEASPLQARLKDCADIINLALQQVRSLSLDLHPAVLDDLGLLPAVRWFVDREAQRGEFNAQVSAQSLPDRFPPEIELVGFRVVQEALTNISRHARAKNVTVEFWQKGSDLHLLIRDDGIGFDKESAFQRVMKSDSLGLLSMQERIALIHGHFEINSAPGQGTEIHARIPLEVT